MHSERRTHRPPPCPPGRIPRPSSGADIPACPERSRRVCRISFPAHLSFICVHPCASVVSIFIPKAFAQVFVAAVGEDHHQHGRSAARNPPRHFQRAPERQIRSEEHTSEIQSQSTLVC